MGARPAMSRMARLLDPESIAIVGVSADLSKHGGRVLRHLRALGYAGEVWGVNPGLPHVPGLEMHPSLDALPRRPDLVISAVPAEAVAAVVASAGGSGGVLVFAGGFGEIGDRGSALEADLVEAASSADVAVLGPNSGGIIRPGNGLAASFLTCLERPAGQIRSGPVAVVSQSGGTASYLHNLSAARGSGLGVSISTGNEIDITLGEAVDAASRLDEIRVVVAVVETVRDGSSFIDAIEASIERAKPVIVCRIGTGDRGKSLMRSHTGAMAVPDAVINGVLDQLGVVRAETPADAYDAAEVVARASNLSHGQRVGIVTHSGGVAILLADLAQARRVDLPAPSQALTLNIGPMLDHGSVNNPLDLGGIIGGPARFAQVVEALTGSGEYDVVLAVSTAHPPAHTKPRAKALIGLFEPVPVVHLWMAGDQATKGLDMLRAAGKPVSEEPRAVMIALAAMTARSHSRHRASVHIGGSVPEWGLPMIDRIWAGDADESVAAADELGYPVVLKVVSDGLWHKTEVGGVSGPLPNAEAVRAAFDTIVSNVRRVGLAANGVQIESYRPGIEMIVGAVYHPVFGPLVSVGSGGVSAELIGDVAFAPAPVDEAGALAMIDRLKTRRALDEPRRTGPADVSELARIVSRVSLGIVGSNIAEVEVNPLIWDGHEWVVADLLVIEKPVSDA
jgi:acetate---CoA ligase (ADP-forming)